MKILLWLVDFFSGEWMLKSRSNSGAIIFLRSLLVSSLIFAAGLAIKSAVDPTTRFEFSLGKV